MPLQLYKIASTEVGSAGVSSFTFSSIPSGYTDLQLVASARTNRSSGATEDSLCLSFNGSTANFTLLSMYGNGSAPGTSSYTTNGALRLVGTADTATANTFSNGSLYIPNYSGSNNKSFSIDSVTENNATEAWTFLTGGLWSQTAAITSITLTPLVGTSIKQYSTLTLYGIL